MRISTPDTNVMETCKSTKPETVKLLVRLKKTSAFVGFQVRLRPPSQQSAFEDFRAISSK